MSLDVYIEYKEPKKRVAKRGLDGIACGSTIAFYDKDTEITEEYWHSNITHNMGKMADHIKVKYSLNGYKYKSTLYQVLWHPEDINLCNTNLIKEALVEGMSYMIKHRDNLLKYNPSNGWGDYDSFLDWIMEYWKACIDNPNCEIEVSR